MAQKIVSYNVAKALKEAGYPQENTEFRYILRNSTFDHLWFKKGELIDKTQKMHLINIADAPTYIDAWMWLWREKGIRIEVCELDERATWSTYIKPILIEEDSGYQDPEEAIVKAIEYLVENNLIK